MISWTRRGHWHVSPEHGIEEVECYHGTNYCLYRWEFPGDVGRELIGVRQSLEDAKKLSAQKAMECVK